MKTSSIAVETSQSTSKVNHHETNELSSSPILHHDEQLKLILLQCSFGYEKGRLK